MSSQTAPPPYQGDALGEAAQALEAHGFAAELWDRDWRLAFVTSEYRTLVSAGRPVASIPGMGAHILSAEMAQAREQWPTGPTFQSVLEALPSWGGFVVATTPGGREAVLAHADPRFRAVLKDVVPQAPPALWTMRLDVKFGDEVIGNDALLMALHSPDGQRRGYAVVVKPEMRAAVLGMLALGDARLFERMALLLQPARRPAAILFGDLEGSSHLARRLSTPAYFALIRRLLRRADRAVVSAGGIVGKHVGDGITAFFLAEELGSESAAARACIEAARAIREAARTAAERSGVPEHDVILRFGLHWGATLYVGRLMTSGRAEVTAMGDEVNEAARMEACGTGGRALASKSLLERLDPADAAAVNIDLAELVYIPLAELPTATDKARRDAPAVAVSEV